MNGKQHHEYVADEFNRAAASSRIVRSYQRRAQTLVLDRLELEPGMNVLDLGCGTGWATLEIASRLRGSGRVIGLDLSEGMIGQAQNKLHAFPYDNAEFVLQSADSLGHCDYFDCVLSTNAFHHFADKVDVFAKVWESLKADGCFVIQDFCRDFFLVRFVDLLGKIGERAHVGTTTSNGLRELFLAPGSVDVHVETIKLNWLWGIMIGRGVKPSP